MNNPTFKEKEIIEEVKKDLPIEDKKYVEIKLGDKFYLKYVNDLETLQEMIKLLKFVEELKKKQLKMDV